MISFAGLLQVSLASLLPLLCVLGYSADCVDSLENVLEGEMKFLYFIVKHKLLARHWLRFKLRTLFLFVTLSAVFLYWAKLETFSFNNPSDYFYFYWKPRGFVNICAYPWQNGYGGNAIVYLQVWPKGYEYPFAIVSDEHKLTIQWAHITGRRNTNE